MSGNFLHVQRAVIGNAPRARMQPRAVAGIFVVAQALLLIGLGHEYIVGALCIGLVASSFLLQPWISLGRFGHAGLLVLGLVVMRVRSHWAPNDLNGLYAFFAGYLLIVQTLEFWRTSARHSTKNYLPGLGALMLAALVMSIDSRLTNATLQWIYLGFAILLVLILRVDLPRLSVSPHSGERRKAIALLFVNVAVIGAGVLLQRQVVRDLPDLQQVFAGFRAAGVEAVFAQNKAQFVESSHLQSVTEAQRANPDDPVFTVEAKGPPGYMRTLAFAEFDGWTWSNDWDDSQFRRLKSMVDGPSNIHSAVRGETGGRFFSLVTESTGPYQRCVVRVPPGTGKLVPMPVRTAYLFGRPRRVEQDPHGTITPGTFDTFGYVTYSGRAVGGIDPRYVEQLTGIPSVDQSLLFALSQQLCSGLSTVRQKKAAVEQYFRRNFEYSLEAEPTRDLGGRSAIRAFLEERREAHCEYFATASALLLRCQGVPCRLCVGYLVYEMNEDEDYYVAANRNAHAWAEAFDASTDRWLIVESTPGTAEYIARQKSGAIDIQQREEIASGPDVSLTLWERLFGAYQRWLAPFSGNATFWLLTLGMLAYLLLRSGKFPSPQPWKRRRGSAYLARADRWAARLGVVRQQHETCHQFSLRLAQQGPQLESLARWYVSFAERRYRMTPQDVDPPPRPSRVSSTAS